MRSTAMLLAIIFILSGVIAPTAFAASVQNQFKPVMPGAQNCFSGSTSSYESFIEFLTKKNRSKISQTFPQQRFEQFQQQLHCEMFVYDVDGVKVTGYLTFPNNAGPGSLPVMVYNRGGNGPFGSLVFSTALHKLMPLAAQGYVVLASNYRGEARLHQANLSFEQQPQDEFGGADVADVLAFKTLIQHIPVANPKHVAMMGHSRGGMQTWLAARQWPELKALVIIAGVTDLLEELQYRPEMEKMFNARMPNYATDKTAVLKQRSVRYFLTDIRPDLPVLIVHGDQDKRVNVAQARLIDELLTKRQQPHELLIYPGGDHALNKQMPQIRQKIDALVRAQLN